MDRVGDDGAGFSLEYEPSSSSVRVRAWGFWSVEIALAFGSKVREACKNRPPGTTLQLDMTHLKPMRDEGQLAFTALIEALPGLGIANTVIATGSQLTKLQLLRIAGDPAKRPHIQFG